jgi:hypothetical protein
MPSRLYRRYAAATFSIAAIATGLAGCGGSSHLSHAQVVSAANAACRQANTAVARIGTPVATLSGLSKYAGQVLPISRKLIGQLDALNATSSDKTALSDYTAALQTGNRGLVMMQRATSPAQAQQAGQLIAKENIPQLADKIGATVCARPPSA